MGAPRCFITERLFHEVLHAQVCGATHPALHRFHTKSSTEIVEPIKSKHSEVISIEVDTKSEVETHVSDGSWVLSSASVVAASVETEENQQIQLELEQLRQEKAKLLAENAALRCQPVGVSEAPERS